MLLFSWAAKPQSRLVFPQSVSITNPSSLVQARSMDKIKALDFHSLPTELRLRYLRFTFTEAQCEGWAGGAIAGGYSARMLETQVAVPYWGAGTRRRPSIARPIGAPW